ncbi:endonuclease domain-containing protein [Bifidobacterium amazonense]|uniref:Endonuclease domain-containing protein n=1 Tax=Bifidobacterium amazonense TaxID=2809027 RepID=A0ABS9VZE2_9BIFI|nr:endonuclease domain-containing protein [Bifidobacterium amazonense]MCH9277279.1 endonuclease domain-containing protein [Bifidobacterium amazonense]
MADDSISLKALTELKTLRVQACAELQRRTRQPLIYTRSTALELLSIEKPKLPYSTRRDSTAWVIVPSLQRRCHVPGVTYLAWVGPIETQVVGRYFECVTPVCAWAHYASVLPLDELVVLGDSMMRRDRRLQRARLEDFAHYLQRASGFTGIKKCRRALLLMREDTDSSQETRVRIILLRYGLPEPTVNHALHIPGTARTVFLDMAYPELRIAIEYDGNHHRFSSAQVLRDDKRREDIESAGWTYIKITYVDLLDESAEEALAQRVATALGKVLGTPVPLEPRIDVNRLGDGNRARRRPIWSAGGDIEARGSGRY